MFFVKYGKEYIHDPRKELILTDAKVEVAVNSGGSFSFTINCKHPSYNKLKLRDSKNPITVWSDEKLIFWGDILSIESDFQMSQEVTCRGELSWLNDSIVRPYSTLTEESLNVAPNGVAGYFEWLINQHNKQVESSKQFTVDINEGQSLDSYIYRSDSTYPTTLDVIKDKIIDSVGGYLRVKHEGDNRYIDLIREYPDDNAQVIDFGVNLLDYVNTDVADDLASFIVPTGVQLRDTWYDYDDGYFKTSDKSPVADKDYYIRTYADTTGLTSFEPKITYYEAKTEIFKTSDKTPYSNIDYYVKNGSQYEKANISEFESGVTYYEIETHFIKTSDQEPVSSKTYYLLNRASYSTVNNIARFQRYETYYEYNAANDRRDDKLTLAMLSDGEPEFGYVHKNDIIYSKDAVERYGWIGAYVDFNDISLVTNLLDRGVTQLKSLLSPVRTIEITALDLSMIKPEYKPIEVGQYVRVRSKPHNFDSYMFCSKIEYDLNKPDNNKFTLGDTFDTLTGQQNKRINYLNSTVNHVYQSAEKISGEAKAAAAAASSAEQIAKRAESSTERVSEEAKAANDLAKSAHESASSANTKADQANDTALAANESAASANTKAEQANDTANTAKESAANANTIANDAQQKADDAQTMANSAQASANKAQTDVTVLTKRVTAAETTIDKNSESITLNATKTTEIGEKIDNLQVGGRNLVLNSNTPNKDSSPTGYPCGKYSLSENVISGEEYTWSVNVTTTNIIKVAVYFGGGMYGTSWANIDSDGTYTLKRTFTASDNMASQNLVCVYARDAQDIIGIGDGTCILNWIKLEKGNKSTDWSPAPEDIESKLANGYYNKIETDAKLKIESDKISSTVTRVETVEKTANDTKTSVDNLQVGGRNLLVLSKSDRYSSPITSSGITISKPDSEGWFTVSGTTMGSGSAKVLTLWGKSVDEANDYLPSESGKYELSVEYTDGTFISGTSYTNSSHIVMYYNGSNRRVAGFNPDYITADVGSYIYRIAYYIGADIPDGTIIDGKFRIKLEKGNKPTDWSPAPEDITGSIDNAYIAADNAQATADNAQATIAEAKSSIEQLSDMISHLIVDENGGSLMTQTKDGWTFNMSSINGNLEAIKDAITAIDDEQSDTNSALEKLTDLINDVASKTAYITVTTDDNGDPCIELGKTTNEFKVRITNTAIDFLEGSTRIAYANNNTFYTTRMIVKDELQIGPGPGFVWKTRSNGNMGLTYISN